MVNAMILLDSSRTLTVTKASEEVYYIKMYNMETFEMLFEEEIQGSYIKLKEVETNASSTKFAVAFNDDGVFKLRTFGRETRGQEEIKESEININDLIGIDAKTMAVSNFPDPFITCCFVSNEVLFVNLFYNFECTHYHFFYDFE
jgi:hypothetical protein